MRKINHIWENGIELKRCSECKEYLSLSCFTKNHKTWDKLFATCKKCTNKRRKHSLKIACNSVWKHLKGRVKKDSNYLRRKVKIKFTEEEFKEWYLKRWFAGCVLDRIDNEGDYEFGNIHIITKAEHNKKQRQDMLKKYNIIEPEGMRYCRNCNQIKPINEFYRKKWRISLYNLIGLDSRCKECNRKARREFYKRKRYPMLDKKKYISFYELMKNPELIKEVKPVTMKEWITEEREKYFGLGRFRSDKEYVKKHPFPKEETNKNDKSNK